MNDQTDRVRRHTAADVLRRIDDDTVASLSRCAGNAEQTGRRLHELDHEWDIDRTLETEAATVGLVGVALGALVRKEFLAIPAIVAAAVLLQASTGRYPWMPLFRRFGLRTSKEIARERYALKALRGDFSSLERTRAAVRVVADERPLDAPAPGHDRRSAQV